MGARSEALMQWWMENRIDLDPRGFVHFSDFLDALEKRKIDTEREALEDRIAVFKNMIHRFIPDAYRGGDDPLGWVLGYLPVLVSESEKLNLALNRQRDELEAEVTRNREGAREWRQEIEELRNEVGALEETRDLLRSARDGDQAEIMRLKEDLEAVESCVSDDRVAMEYLHSHSSAPEGASAMGTVGHVFNTMAALRSDNENLRTRIETLEGTQGEEVVTRNAIEFLRHHSEAARSGTAWQTVRFAVERITALKEGKQEALERITQLVADCAQLRRVKRELEERIANQRSTIEEYQDENRTQRERIKVLTALDAGNVVKAEDQAQRIKELEIDIDRRTREVEMWNADNLRLQVKIDGLKAGQGKLGDANASLRRKCYHLLNAHHLWHWVTRSYTFPDGDFWGMDDE